MLQQQYQLNEVRFAVIKSHNQIFLKIITTSTARTLTSGTINVHKHRPFNLKPEQGLG